MGQASCRRPLQVRHGPCTAAAAAPPPTPQPPLLGVDQEPRAYKQLCPHGVTHKHQWIGGGAVEEDADEEQEGAWATWRAPDAMDVISS